MAKFKDSWGIEVGANAIKAMHLTRDGDDVAVVGYDIIPFKKVLTTPDLDMDEAIQVGLDQFLARHDVSKCNVVLSVPGHMAFARFAKLPPVEPKKIAQIVMYEAIQQIPFPINQVEWDYQVFQQADSPDVEVGIFAIAKERIATFLNNYQKMGIKVDAVTLSPVAVMNAFAHDLKLMDGEKGSIILDIGTQSTDLIVVEGGRVWLRTMAIGGNNFTDSLVKAFKLSFPKAEKLKREAGTSKYARQIFQAMRPVFADLVQEIQRSLGFYQTSNRDAELHQLIGVGSTFRLPGLQKFLKQQLSLEVIRPDGFKRLKVDGKHAADFAENAINLATVYGLALQGLEMEKVSANVMPESLQKARLWRAKQPWIGAAAALVLVATGAAFLRAQSEYSAYQSLKEQTNQSTAATLSKARSLLTEYNEKAKKSDPRMRIENLQRILDYRDVWPKLLEDIGDACGALGAQEALSKTNYEEQKKITRGNRRRVFITSYEATYVEPKVVTPAPAAGAAPPPPAQGAPKKNTFLSTDDAFSRASAPATPAGVQPPGVQPAQPAADPNAPAPHRPYFEITITGTTPYAEDPSGFLDRNFVKWLREKSTRAGRPYVITFVPISPNDPNERYGIVSLTPLRDTVKKEGAQPGTPAKPVAPDRRPDGLIAPRPDGLIRPPTGGGGDTAKQSVTDLLFPANPLAEESAENDHAFIIKWRVELRSPDEVRQNENAAPAQPAATKAAAAPSAQTVQEPRS